MQDTSNNAADRLLAHRWYPGAVLRPDGRILVISGQDVDGMGTGYVTPCLHSLPPLYGHPPGSSSGLPREAPPRLARRGCRNHV